MQDIGEDLVSLLHYQERGQIIAVTSTGSAIILSRSSGSTGGKAAAAAGADAWSVLLRMKITNTASGSGLQVSWLDADSARLTQYLPLGTATLAQQVAERFYCCRQTHIYP